MNKKKIGLILSLVLLVAAVIACSCMTVFAAGDVSSAIQSTWNDAKTQIQNVVNNVVFPVPAARILTTESTGSSSSRLRRSFSRV